MGRARQSHVRTVSRKIDHTSWDLFSLTFSALSAGSSALTCISAGTVPVTLMRARGEVLGSMDGTSGPGDLVLVTWGVHRVPEGTGATVLTEPFGDPNADWWLYGQGVLGYEEMVTDVVDVPGITSFRTIVDNKGMRKIPPDAEFQLVVTNTTLIVTSAVNVAVNVRFLLGF